MPKINFKDQVLPHLVAIAIFLLVAILYYQPIFFENQSIRMNDVLQGFGGGQEVKEFRTQTGEEALWTNSMFGGMPAYLISVYWSGDLLEYVQKALTFGLPSPASVTFLSLICFYILLLVFGVRPYLAIVGAVAYGLSTFSIISIEAGHIWKVRAMAYMPLVVAGFKLLFEKRSSKLWGFVMVALGLALEIKANHLQITYYLAIALSFYGVSLLIFTLQEKSFPSLLKNVGILMGAVLVALACNLGRLWTVMEYGQYSTRGKSDLVQEGNKNSKSGLEKDYVFNWSSGKLESMTFLIPNFYGGASQQSLDDNSNLAKALRRNGASPQQVNEQIQSTPTYWGQQPGVAGPIYMGAIICFLFILGALVVEKRHRYWLIAATVFAIILSWGKNFEAFNYFMFDYFPGYNKFRSVSMAVAIAMLAMPLLGFLGLEAILVQGWNKATQKNLLIALGVVGGLCLLVAAFAGMADFKGLVDERMSGLPDWYIDALRDDRKGLMRSDALRSLGFIVVFASALFFTLKKSISPIIGIAIMGLLMLLDLWIVDKRHLNEENFGRNPKRQFFAATEADKKIKQDKGEFRVLNLQNPWSEARTSYHHSSIGGYHGAKPKRYSELMDNSISDEINKVIERLRVGNTSFEGLNSLNMLNTKYFTFGGKAEQVIMNSNAYGNAWLVSSVKKVNSANEEIESTTSLKDKHTAIIDVSRFEVSEQSSGKGTITMTDYTPNHLIYTASVDGNSLALFSEAYYAEGWKAYIDGKEKKIVRANYILRALEVPNGEHTIEFKFEPTAYHLGNKVMMAASGLLLILFAFSAFTALRDNKNA